MSKTIPEAPEVPANGRFIVTPQRALQWIRRYNTKNRRISREQVLNVVGWLVRKEWMYNGEPICFSDNGRLLQGQHRLAGCIEANLPIDTDIRIGIPDAAFTTYDGHKPRRAADVLGIEGEKNTYRLAATIAWVFKHENGNLRSKDAPSRQQSREILKRHPGLRDSVSVLGGKFFKKGGGSSVASFIHYIAGNQNIIKRDQFFTQLEKGEGLMGDNPVYHLRDRIISNLSSKAKLPVEELLALYIKAWTAFRDGRPMFALRWRNSGNNPETFPRL